jgi:magnesium-transporting ATPase (P-type)
VVVALTLLYAGPAIFHLQPVPGDPEQTEINRAINRTMVFNTFVFLQIFNEFNARSIDQRMCAAALKHDHFPLIDRFGWGHATGLNVFKNLGKHYIFQAVLVITVILQALIIQARPVAIVPRCCASHAATNIVFLAQFGGQAFKTYPLNWWQWLVCICLGPLSLVVGTWTRSLVR